MKADPAQEPYVTGPEEVHAFVADVLGDSRLIVVTNREPYEHVRRGDRVTERKTVGGVVSALDPLMQALGGTWIAWGSGNADRDVVDASDSVRLPSDHPSYRLRRIWLSEEEVDKFYNGHVNQTLWPLCHLQTEKIRFLRDEWTVYEQVNQRFAQAAAGELDQKPGIVWFQDYHFALAPAMLRKERPDAVIMQFWHIPWPPWEIFRQHPERRALLEGLLGCDIIGMHIGLYCENFLDCVHRELGLPVDTRKGHVLSGDRIIRVRPFPVSVDAAHIDALARSPGTTQQLRQLRERNGLDAHRIAISVERGDYTKGILLRLRALDVFFSRFPEWKGKVMFLQVTPSSREAIPAYRLFTLEMNRLVRNINARHGTGSWQPVTCIRTAVQQKELIGLFQLADIAVVSVRYDGMNLVSKEYVAARCDGDGVLVLSEFAGAAEEIHEAILINPYDVEGFAAALDRAMRMPEDERRHRMRQMRDAVFGNTVYDWIMAVFGEVLQLQNTGREGGPRLLLEHLEELSSRIRKTGHTALFCDYDGVLAPIASRPEEARIDQHVRDLLVKLRDSASVHVSVISGRALNDVADLVSIERLTYAGNHGLEISGPRVQRIHPAAQQVRAVLDGLYDEMREAMRPFPGVIVEDKRLGVALHYRLADPGQLSAISSLFYRLVDRRNIHGNLRITTGKCLLEVRPRVGWDKGRAVLWLLEAIHGREWRQRVLPVYLGDDETDEDAFRVLRRSGVTVLVGAVPESGSAAEFRLERTADVNVLLEWMTHHSL